MCCWFIFFRNFNSAFSLSKLHRKTTSTHKTEVAGLAVFKRQTRQSLRRKPSPERPNHGKVNSRPSLLVIGAYGPTLFAQYLVCYEQRNFQCYLDFGNDTRRPQTAVTAPSMPTIFVLEITARVRTKTTTAAMANIFGPFHKASVVLRESNNNSPRHLLDPREGSSDIQQI